MKRARFDWRKYSLSIAAGFFIALYAAFFVIDLMTGKGLENLGFYLVMVICLCLMFGATIVAPERRKKNKD